MDLLVLYKYSLADYEKAIQLFIALYNYLKSSEYRHVPYLFINDYQITMITTTAIIEGRARGFVEGWLASYDRKREN